VGLPAAPLPKGRAKSRTVGLLIDTDEMDVRVERGR
jgi:hypothetical protein